jgi:uncharacterized protein (DUF433 family)
MTRRVTRGTDFEGWAATLEMSVADAKAAWQELHRRGLVSARHGHVTVSPWAMRRATSEAQRRLATHLSGSVLTENSFIVRRAGDPPGLPCILNTRIAIEQIANYFRDGWGVTEIEWDLGLLTRQEIEAAMQYYLNHRAEIEASRQRSRTLYEAHAAR